MGGLPCIRGLRAVVELGFDTLMIAGLHTTDARRRFAGQIAPRLRRPAQPNGALRNR
jgi:hypothetical protein